MANITHILCMSGDWEDGAPGPRSVARIIEAGDYATEQKSPQVYFAATNTPKCPDMEFMALSMYEVFTKNFPHVTAIVLEGDEEWSSRGEFRKLFAQVPVGERIVLVSGQYHLDRLKLIVAKYHPDHAPYVEYHNAEGDRLTLGMWLIEIPKHWLIKMPESCQKKIRYWQQRVLKFLPV